MFKWAVSGVLIGVANLIPGVSGATLAVITGQYRNIMTQITVITTGQLSQIAWRYLISIGFSAIGGIVVLSGPLHFALEHYEALTLVVIAGLVLGSISAVKLGDRVLDVLARYGTVFFVLGLGVVLALLYLDKQGVMLHDVSSKWALFLSGFVAMVAMIIPGISGSLVLLMMGTYNIILSFIKGLMVLPLLPFVLGAAIGGVGTAHGVQWLIRHYARPLESFIVGLLWGSVVYILAQAPLADIPLWTGVLVFGVSVWASYRLVQYGNR